MNRKKKKGILRQIIADGNELKSSIDTYNNTNLSFKFQDKNLDTDMDVA